MPFESAVLSAIIVLIFVGFAIVLWWGDRQTRHIRRQ